MEYDNFRDAGAFINLIAGKSIIKEDKLYRGGNTDHVDSLSHIGSPSTIINLRNSCDLKLWDVGHYHFPMSNKVEKYDTSQKKVRHWIESILTLLNEQELSWPVFIHCLSGKDRTGIIVAAILKVVGINDNYIIEEYLLSDGKVSKYCIQSALDGMNEWKNPLTNFKVANLKKELLY